MRMLLVGVSLLALVVPAASRAQNATSPEMAQSGTAAEGGYMVYFALDRASLDEEGRQTVGRAAADWRRTGAVRLSVIGHTDTTASAGYNMELSQRRAAAVAAELERQGVPAADIETLGRGEQDLLVQTADGVAERRNRRVEIIVPQPGAPAPVAAAPATPQPAPPAEPGGRFGFTLAPMYGHNFRETDQGDDGTENDLAGIELGLMALPGYLGGVSLKQGVLWSFNGEDDGLTGRTVASIDFAPDLGMFQPVFSINAGGVYGKGVQDGFVAGPEIGFGLDLGGFVLRPKIAYDYQFRNPSWDEGILWGGLDLGLQF